MPVLAQLQPLSDSPTERRRAPRLLLKLGAKVGSGSSAVVHDISTRGLLFETGAELGAARIHVHLPDVPAAKARVVWSHGHFYGCEFEEPIPNSSVSAALLRSDPKALSVPVPANWHEAATPEPRRRGVGTLLLGAHAYAVCSSCCDTAATAEFDLLRQRHSEQIFVHHSEQLRILFGVGRQ
jgi:hypothetical protein